MNTFKKIGQAFGLMFVALCAMLMMTGTSAFAGGVDDGTSNGSGSTITSTSSSSSSDEATVTSSSSVGVKITSKTVSYVKANGMPKSEQTKCFKLKKKASYYTSYINVYGHEVWHWKSYSKGKKFCKGSDGWYHDTVCYNKVKIHAPKVKPHGTIIKGKIKVIKAFSFVAKAQAKAAVKSLSNATAWCRTDYSYASATGSGSGYAEAYASSSASGTTKLAAEAAAKTAAKKLSLSVSFTESLKAKAEASAHAAAESDATAKVTCSNAPTTPPTAKPSLLETDTVNDVLVNNTRTITVSGTVAPDHSATLFASAKNGGSITAASKTQTVSGNFTVQVTYQAPSEAPEANNGVAAGKDQVVFTLTQDDGQSASTSTNQFNIKVLRDDKK